MPQKSKSLQNLSQSTEPSTSSSPVTKILDNAQLPPLHPGLYQPSSITLGLIGTEVICDEHSTISTYTDLSTDLLPSPKTLSTATVKQPLRRSPRLLEMEKKQQQSYNYCCCSYLEVE